MKHTFENIKKLVSCNTVTAVYQNKYENYICFSGVNKNGNLIGSSFRDEKELVIIYNSDVSWNKKDINYKTLELIQLIPISHKEITDLVDIIDCEEIRAFADKNYWSENKKGLIGKKGLETARYENNNYGQYYIINHYPFPARFVVPHIEGETKSDLSDAELIEELERRGRVSEGKIIK